MLWAAEAAAAAFSFESVDGMAATIWCAVDDIDLEAVVVVDVVFIDVAVAVNFNAEFVVEHAEEEELRFILSRFATTTSCSRSNSNVCACNAEYKYAVFTNIKKKNNIQPMIRYKTRNESRRGNTNSVTCVCVCLCHKGVRRK